MVHWVFGVHPVLEMLRARPRSVREIILARRGGERVGEVERLARSESVPLRHVHRREIDELADGLAHQGMAAAVEMEGQGAVCPDPGDPVAIVDSANEAGETPLLLALDRIQDPRNLGALLRSAHAFGAHGVIAPRDRASDLTPAAVKASAGAAAHLPVCRVTNLARTLDELKTAGLWVIGADVPSEEGARPSRAGEAGPRKAGKSGDSSAREITEADRADLSGPLALVIGAEGAGLRRLVRERCDRLVQIPMAGRIGSINASVAGGILLYEVLRQRRGGRRS